MTRRQAKEKTTDAASRRVRSFMECGGKRSATPLWITKGNLSSAASFKAPSSLRFAGALQNRCNPAIRTVKQIAAANSPLSGRNIIPNPASSPERHHQRIDFLKSRLRDLRASVVIPSSDLDTQNMESPARNAIVAV